MMRVALSIYLMFATLAGPWLCCCSITRMVHLLASLCPQEAQPPTETCCHSKASLPAVPDTEHQRSDEPGRPGDEEPCPCQHKGSPAALTLPTNQTTCQDLLLARADELVPSVAIPIVHVTTATSDPNSGPPGCLDAPFVSARDLLHSLHVLRC
jgi:hypothetical protein